jgi:hypothetical protein
MRMNLFLKCKLPNCGTPLKPPNQTRAENDYRYEELKGWCSQHDWQPLTLDEQAAMIGLVRGEAKRAPVTH